MARIGWIDVTYTQSISNNTSTITVKGVIQTTEDSYRGDHRTGTYTIKKGSTTIASGSFTKGAPKNSTTTLFTKTITVNHASDGTYGTITVSYNYDSGWATATQSASIPTIKRASVLGSISNFTLGNTITIPITRYAFTDTLVVSVNGSTVKTVTGLATTSYSLSFTDAELTTIYSKIPNNASASFTFTLKTMNETTQIGTSTKTAIGSIPSTVKPTISDVTIAEGGDLVPEGWNVYIQNKSKLNVVTSAKGGSGASISSVKVTVDGSSYTGEEIITNTLTKSGTLSVSIEVADSRGRKATTSKSITIYAYSPPYISTFTALRCDSNGTVNNSASYVKSTLKGGVSSVNGKNTYEYVLKYKKTEETQWIETVINEGSTTLDEVILKSDIDTNNSYDFIAVVSDAFTSVESKVTVPSAYVVLDLLAGAKGIALGKVAELTDYFDVNFNSRFRKHIAIDNNKNINGTFTDGTYGSLIGLNENDNILVGYGTYGKESGSTNVYGNKINFYSRTNVYSSTRLQFANDKGITGTTTDGDEFILLSLNNNNNTVLGYGGYDKDVGVTNVYGCNLNLYSKDAIYLSAPNGVTFSKELIVPNNANGKLTGLTTTGERVPLINMSTSNNIYIADGNFTGNVNIYGNKVTYAGTPLIVKPGDTLSVGGFNVGGFISSSTTTIQFDIPIGKIMCGISSVTVNSLYLNMRKVEGGYLGANEYVSGGVNAVTNSSYTVTATPKVNQGSVSIKIVRNTSFTTTNNTPVAIECHKCELTFA